MASVITRHHRKISLKTSIQLFVVSMLVYIILGGIAGLGKSLYIARNTNVAFLALAIGVIAASYFFAALTYVFLAVRPIKLGPTLWVSVAGGLVNRLLPGGIGGLGLNALYLKRQGHSLSVASVIVASNNILGGLGNLLLLTVVIINLPITLPHRHLPRSGLLIAMICTVIILAVAFILKKAVFAAAILAVKGYVVHVLSRPVRACEALLSSMCLTACHATGLYFVLWALHYPVTWPIALVAVSAGSLTGAVIPTPGGIGGAEAGIAAMLVSLSLPAAQATAAAIVYRLITYWLPLVPGYLALRVAEKRYI